MKRIGKKRSTNSIRKCVGTVDEFKHLAMKQCDIGRRSIIVCRVRDTFYAVDALCTHEAFTLVHGMLSSGGIITCPMHGAKFDVKTGKVKTLPATIPLHTYPVEIFGKKIFVVIPASGSTV